MSSFVCHERGCGKKYDSKADLDFHVGKRHNFGNQGAFGCAQCDKRYVCMEDLDFHRSRRHGVDSNNSNASTSTPSPNITPPPVNSSGGGGGGGGGLKPRSVTAVRSIAAAHSTPVTPVSNSAASNANSVRRQTSPAPRLPVGISEGLHVAIRARNAPEQNELSFAVGDKLLVLKVDSAHNRVYASNESRASISGWAPIAALRVATDAEIASRVSGVSGAYNASLSSSSPAPPASPPDDDDLDNGPTQYSNGVSHMKFASADSLPDSLPDVVVASAVTRNPSASRINRVMEAAEQQYGMRPRGPLSGSAPSSANDPYALVSSELVENMDKMAAAFAAPVPPQREGIATGYAAARPPAALPQQVEGIARGYSSGAGGGGGGVPVAAGGAYTRPAAQMPPHLRAQQHGAPTEQYGQLQLIPRGDQQQQQQQSNDASSAFY